jgi:plasmid stability protein
MLTIKIQIPDEAAARLRARAQENGRSIEEQAGAFIAAAFAQTAEADDLSDEEWEEIDRAIAEADRGEFATDEEVEAAYADFKG